MSGQLVGEVIAAMPELKARGLSERGFHALVAIAEKCHIDTRQGSVPWSYIRAGLYGASLSTAKRAISDLKKSGALRVVKRGFNNNHGRVCAPIYQIEPLSERVTQVTQSPVERTGHPGDAIALEPMGQTGERTGQTEGRTGHPGDLLNGSTSGSKDGGARASANAPPSPQCPKHINDENPPPCHGCRQAREAAQVWDLEHEQHRQALRADIRNAIDNCDQCDDYGRPFDGSSMHCPRHPNFRQRPELALKGAV
jgi:hypothetical protein